MTKPAAQTPSATAVEVDGQGGGGGSGDPPKQSA